LKKIYESELDTMPQKMKITISIEDENGQEIINSASERDLPTLREFEAQGFRPSLNQIDKAVLEARKEATDKAIEEYLEDVSKKKLMKNSKNTRKGKQAKRSASME
jgi:hypothetical protein